MSGFTESWLLNVEGQNANYEYTDAVATYLSGTVNPSTWSLEIGQSFPNLDSGDGSCFLAGSLRQI
jgi:hypothetical protein